jgi:hypothetical protein
MLLTLDRHWNGVTMSLQQHQPRASAAVVLLAAIAFALATPAGPEAAKTDITVDFDKTFSFVGLRTWAWNPAGAGDVKMAVSSQDDPKAVAARVDPVIVPAVEKEMAARGFTKVADNAALYVHYYALATMQQSAQVQGQFLPGATQWALPPFLTNTTALSTYPYGTLLIDIVSPKLQAIVWRGAAQREIEFEKADADRRKVLQKSIHDLLDKFPPKPAKS